MRINNVGIKGIEIYFPKTYINQSELEKFDGVPQGKYTIGLGQENMAFTEPYEDVNSLSLTVVQQLLEKYNIHPNQIGRLEVGTETLIDKSKSTKTVLMQLFTQFGNHDIEGVTSINACYGGTNALFNAINWVQSDIWDGRLAIVVCVDIAVYAKGPARPTGGAGAIAMLIGPDAPLVFEPVRSTFFDNVYDFYKPDPTSEYPTVDGQLSIQLYLNAIDQCYKMFKQKFLNKYGKDFSTNDVDYLCFHSPFFKMVQKSFNRLIMHDINNKKIQVEEGSKINDELINKVAASYWKQKVYPSTLASRQLGNIYTGSLYGGLVSLMDQVDLANKKILLFSYGSGLAASLFMLHGRSSTKPLTSLIQLSTRLNNRIRVPIQEYDELMMKRQREYGQLQSGKLVVNFERLNQGTYYLDSIDEKWRRTYKRHQPPNIGLITNLTAATNEKNINRLSQFKNQLSQFEYKSKNPYSIHEQQQQYNKLWAGFYKKTVQQRQDQLETVQQVEIEHLKTGGLSIQNADLMVENCIGKVSIPVGLGLNFLINGTFYTIPMATEEPSVIAAASSAAKLISEKGSGFKAYSSRPVMMGQVQLLHVRDPERVKCIIDQNKKSLIELGNEVATKMVERGGGVEDIKARFIGGNQMSVDVFVNVCDSMGANLVNTVCEHISPMIEHITNCQTGIKILTNLCMERKINVSFELDINEMSWKGVTGRRICEMILEAQKFAQLDIFRAVTHNKGIMNGVEAVALAAGQDCRAINASLHAYALVNGKYQPLSEYILNGDRFIGCMTVPISVGTQGGAIPSNPFYQTVLDILQNPNAQSLGEIMACVGLASNVAALRALCVEGIQKGHMNLHARNLAIASGVPPELVEEAVRFMRNRGKLRKESAEEFQKAYSLYREVRDKTLIDTKKKHVLSTFSAEFLFEEASERIDLHIVFDCGSEEPIHVSFKERDNQTSGLQLRNYIFGTRGYEWLKNLFKSLQLVRLEQEYSDNSFPTKTLVYKLKLIAILSNLIASNMISHNYQKSKELIGEIQNVYIILSIQTIIRDLNSLLSHEPVEIKFGLNLLCELIRIFKYNLEQFVPDLEIRKSLMEQLMLILTSHLRTQELWQDAKQGVFDFKYLQNCNLKKKSMFFASRKKRLSCTMMLLCDAINLKPNFINSDFLSLVKEIGDMYELEITLARDSSKWQQQSISVKQFQKRSTSDPNLYTYWLLQNGLLLKGEKSETVQSFLKQTQEQIDKRREELEPKLTEEIKHLSQKTSQLVKKQYLHQMLENTPKL